MKHYAGRFLAALTVAGSLAACSGSDHMNDENVAPLRADIAAARTEVGRHHEAAMAATALGNLPGELDRHDEQMDGIMNRMGSRMGGMMSHCSGSGMGDMHDMMSRMGSEMQAHREGMTAAATLEEARGHCTEHTDRMSGMLDGMRDATGAMGCVMDR